MKRIYLRRFIPVLLGIVGFWIGSIFDRRDMEKHSVRIRSRLGTTMICDFETTNRECLIVSWATNYTTNGVFYYGTKKTVRFR